MTEAAVVAPVVAAPAAVTPPPADTAWWSGLDEETRGYVQNKGLASKPINEAFVAVSKFHREAEKMIGAPASELVRLPKEANSPEWAQVHQRLGKPVAATEYDFNAVKRAGDKPIDAALTDTLRQAAFDAHLNKEAAARLAASVVKHLDGIDSAALADSTARLDQEKKLLKDNWGTNEAANMVVARAAANALGVAPEAVAALEKTIGYSKVMEMFRNIGSKIGEDRFVMSNGGGGSGVMTKDQAISEKSALKTDKAWVSRFLNGGTEERRKMEALDRIISGVSA